MNITHIDQHMHAVHGTTCIVQSGSGFKILTLDFNDYQKRYSPLLEKFDDMRRVLIQTSVIYTLTTKRTNQIIEIYVPPASSAHINPECYVTVRYSGDGADSIKEAYVFSKACASMFACAHFVLNELDEASTPLTTEITEI